MVICGRFLWLLKCLVLTSKCSFLSSFCFSSPLPSNSILFLSGFMSGFGFRYVFAPFLIVSCLSHRRLSSDLHQSGSFSGYRQGWLVGPWASPVTSPEVPKCQDADVPARLLCGEWWVWGTSGWPRPGGSGAAEWGGSGSHRHACTHSIKKSAVALGGKAVWG